MSSADLHVSTKAGRLATVAVAGGVALRLLHYMTARSLWLDEASLALNIGTRSFAGLVRPLDYNQTAPLVFLWAEKAATLVGGMNELSMRFVPFVAGVAALLGLRRLVCRVLAPPGAVLALAIAAVSPGLISYSAEAKSYSVDVLVAVILLRLSFDLLDAPDELRAWRRLVLVGLAALLISTVAPLIICGAGLALVCSRHVRDSPGALRRIFASGAVLAAATIGLYLAFYRAADSAYMNTIWRANFLTPGSPDFFSRLGRTLRDVAWWTFAPGSSDWSSDPWLTAMVNYATVILVGCAVLGAVNLLREKGRDAALLLASPIIMAFGASAARQYPIALRLSLFMVPSLIILVAAGVGRLAAPAGQRRRRLLLAAAAVCWLGSVLVRDLASLPKPPRLADGRTVIRDLEARHAAGEPVYVFSRALTVWGFYTTDWALPDTARLGWMSRVGGLGGPAFENASGRGRAVVEQESEGLDYAYRDRTELIGISTGVQWRGMADFSQPTADTGWAAHEADRIRRGARPTAWLFFTHVIDYAYVDLLEAVKARGARIVYQRIEPGAGVFRVSFE